MDISFSLLIVSSCLLGCLGGAGMVKWGNRLCLIDHPSDRSSHNRATPKGGGVGILLSVIIFSLILNAPLHLFIPAAFVSLIGFLGDRYDMDPKLRLILQFCAVLFLISGHQGPIFNRSFDQNLLASILSFLFWMLFIAGTANFFNFMDGIDGIAAISGIVAFGLLAMYGLSAGKKDLPVVLSSILFFSCAGFLPWNFPRAKVFMGDVGSILLGFLFAAIVMIYTESLKELLVLISFIFPFYADELITMAERIRDKDSLIKPHRRHLYQVMVNDYAIEHWKVSVGYGVAQFIIGMGVWKAADSGLFWTIIVLSIFAVLFGMVNYRFKRIRMQDQQ